MNNTAKLFIVFFAFLGIMAYVFMLSSCDDHLAVDHSVVPGKVLCNDHSTMDLESYLSQDRVRCVGVVFAGRTSEHPALAVLLKEIPALSFSDTLVNCGTSTSTQDYDGYGNTVKIRNSGYSSPLASYVFDSHAFEQSDYIPSYAEMKLLSLNADIVNSVMRVLRDHHPDQAVDLLSVTSDAGSCWYWTSTEDSVDTRNMAWLASMATGGFLQTSKLKRHPARAIVALSY